MCIIYLRQIIYKYLPTLLKKSINVILRELEMLLYILNVIIFQIYNVLSFEVMGVTNPIYLECVIGEYEGHITIDMQNVCIGN